MDLNLVMQVIGTAAAVAVPVGGLCAYLLRGHSARTEAQTKATAALAEELHQLATDLAVVKAQMAKNGGSSLRDALDRVDTKTDRIDGRFDGIAADLARLAGRFDQHIAEGPHARGNRPGPRP